MTGKAMKISIDQLGVTNAQLESIISEFEAAAANQDSVERAVGRPYGDSRLQKRCHDFEGSWNDSRDKLLTKLKEISERVKGTVEEVTSLDREIANSMTDATR